MNFFLKLKHWQVFLLLTGLYWIYAIVVATIFLLLQNPIVEIIDIVVTLLLRTLSVVFYFGWFYALGVNLNEELPDTVEMSLKKFKWSLFLFPIVCMVFPIVVALFGNMRAMDNPVFYWIVFSILFFSIFYSYFNAKSLKAVELQRPVVFKDYIGMFFLFLFYPIGIWVIQPRINKIFDETLQNEKDERAKVFLPQQKTDN